MLKINNTIADNCLQKHGLHDFSKFCKCAALFVLLTKDTQHAFGIIVPPSWGTYVFHFLDHNGLVSTCWIKRSGERHFRTTFCQRHFRASSTPPRSTPSAASSTWLPCQVVKQEAKQLRDQRQRIADRLGITRRAYERQYLHWHNR